MLLLTLDALSEGCLLIPALTSAAAVAFKFRWLGVHASRLEVRAPPQMLRILDIPADFIQRDAER